MSAYAISSALDSHVYWFGIGCDLTVGCQTPSLPWISTGLSAGNFARTFRSPLDGEEVVGCNSWNRRSSCSWLWWNNWTGWMMFRVARLVRWPEILPMIFWTICTGSCCLSCTFPCLKSSTDVPRSLNNKQRCFCPNPSFSSKVSSSWGYCPCAVFEDLTWLSRPGWAGSREVAEGRIELFFRQERHCNSITKSGVQIKC